MCTDEWRCHSLGQVKYVYELINTKKINNGSTFFYKCISSSLNRASEGMLCHTGSRMWMWIIWIWM